MTKTIMIGLVAIAFVAGSIATGTIAFADDDDELSQLACEAGKAMTGILFEDDEEITTILCGAQLQGPAGADGAPGPPGTTLWSGLTGVPVGFADNVDNIDDADADPNNEIQKLSIVYRSERFFIPASDPNSGAFIAAISSCLPGEIVVGGGYNSGLATTNVPIQQKGLAGMKKRSDLYTIESF